MSCVRCRVQGRVQGVFFRGATSRQAQSLGITGYARNLADGTVEVLACGEPEAIRALQAWLWSGPPAAEVSAVDCEVVQGEQARQPPPDFTTG